MVKVRVIKQHFDRQKNEYISKGEFEVDEKRAEVLVNAGVCELVVEEQADCQSEESENESTADEEPKADEESEPKKKSTRTRAGAK